LRAFKRERNWAPNYFILSKEKNPVVSMRAEKLMIDCVQSLSDKALYLANYLDENNLTAEGLVYLGNDLNDLGAMQIAGFSVAPVDSHPLVLHQADLVLPKAGGDGFIREFIEILIGIESMSANEIVNLFVKEKV